MLIRDATETDWPAIWAFFEPICRAGDTFCYPTDPAFEFARDLWMLASPNRTVVAVDDDGTVVGSANMHRNRMGNGGHFASGNYMVAESARGRGVGRALCEASIAWAEAEGYRGMQFNAVVETNTPAVELYRSLGFRILGTLPDGFDHPQLGLVGLHSMYLLFDRESRLELSSSPHDDFSGSTSPCVWSVGQYCAVVLANEKSRMVSPQTGQGSPARPCTRMEATLAALSPAIGTPRCAVVAPEMTPTVASKRRSSSAGRQGCRMPDGRELRREQDLVGVGVPDAGERLLILQHGLHLLATAGDGSVELRSRERRIGRVGSELRHGGHLAGVVDDPASERHPLARVGELEGGSVVELEHHERGRRVIGRAGIVGGAAGLVVGAGPAGPAVPAERHHEVLCRAEREVDELAVPRRSGQGFTDEGLGRACAGLRRSELDDVDAGECSAGQPRAELLGERLDLWRFRHDASLPRDRVVAPPRRVQRAGIAAAATRPRSRASSRRRR